MRWHLALAASHTLKGCAAEPGAVVCITCQLGQAVSCDTRILPPHGRVCLRHQPPRGESVSGFWERPGGLLSSVRRLGFRFHNLPILGALLGPLKAPTGWHTPVPTLLTSADSCQLCLVRDHTSCGSSLAFPSACVDASRLGKHHFRRLTLGFYFSHFARLY